MKGDEYLRHQLGLLAAAGSLTLIQAAPRRGGVINNLLAIFIDPARFTELPYFHREVEAVICPREGFAAGLERSSGLDRG